MRRLETESGTAKIAGAHPDAAAPAGRHADTTAPDSNVKMDAEKGLPNSGEDLRPMLTKPVVPVPRFCSPSEVCQT